MDISKVVRDILLRSYSNAKENKNEYVTPEHLLLSALEEDYFVEIIKKLNGDVEELKSDLISYIDEYVDKIEDGEPEESFGIRNILIVATQQAAFSEKNVVALEHIIAAIYALKDSYAVFFLEKQGINKQELLFELSHNKSEEENVSKDAIRIIRADKAHEKQNKSIINSYCTNLIDAVSQEEGDPLIGRKDIIDRTIQILCRRTKNNPVHIGEPGVGKTAITLGLAKLIKEGNVPDKLKNAQIFSLDIGTILAGTKYRGDFEERIKQILDEIKTYENPIVYIDEIHNIVGAGALNGSSLDGGSLIKGYLLEGKIRFIGATTFDDYKKYFEKDKALIRRFQVIEVKETSIKETVKILEGIRENFEEYHKVKFTNESLKAAVDLSAKYINDRFLPDKAIDIIDEAGAYVDINRETYKDGIVDERVIEEIISKICHIPKQTIENTEIESLKILESELKKNIFGQDQAIEEVTRCIKMSRAGLNDDNKPVASMLFVGPTGVGKTEIARVLAKTLGVDLVRFDMSEYGEKHAASKLIGSPPGYVGYEEGGLLTDTIRKKPNCVLLLDEIEKAHSDILSVLLQVMDYATLTDNKGRKADFRNVIIIMTSNAGARDIGKNLVGFARDTIKMEAISDEVKRAFTPEFRNRLDKVVVFNQINKEMAKDIAQKELSKFKYKLTNKSVNLEFSEECIDFVSEKGLSKEFGAREILRVINSEIKPLLVDELLFGELSNGGSCKIVISNSKFKIEK
ncbi:ATP-dependent Clp protease ATP-binding subunit ClpA [Clostridium sp. DSM 100503]|uniref:ATP-dependent Clp protease ATP-binding subunit ClpA n=1 Tax=Clostridium sp. DSM 100503 TaxID=2963282 RepID=UPI002149DE94|nr:ATP-dependent Clp protease ATP-binding subunit ClpA [Clostridium sp. DSM 100503]MCR1951413.1 ATP-dependent Clp protease ATP-binding subunit ClpA [Clostridium sp. DSM 100503]